MSDQDKHGYAVSADAAKTDASPDKALDSAPTLDVSKCFIVIDGETVQLIDLLRKIHKA